MTIDNKVNECEIIKKTIRSFAENYTLAQDQQGRDMDRFEAYKFIDMYEKDKGIRQVYYDYFDNEIKLKEIDVKRDKDSLNPY